MSGQLILYSMKHFAKTSFVVAATIALAARLVNGLISEANSNSSNASSIGPRFL